MCRKFSSIFRVWSRAAATLYRLLRFSFSLLSSRISSRSSFRPRVISYLYACMKNFRSKSSEASSLRSHVTNHMSRGARFRSTPKRGERWNCGCYKNASRCDDWEIILSRWNFCRVIQRVFMNESYLYMYASRNSVHSCNNKYIIRIKFSKHLITERDICMQQSNMFAVNIWSYGITNNTDNEIFSTSTLPLGKLNTIFWENPRSLQRRKNVSQRKLNEPRAISQESSTRRNNGNVIINKKRMRT